MAAVASTAALQPGQPTDAYGGATGYGYSYGAADYAYPYGAADYAYPYGAADYAFPNEAQAPQATDVAADMSGWHSHISYERRQPDIAPAFAPPAKSPWIDNRVQVVGNADDRTQRTGRQVWVAMTCCLLGIALVLTALVLLVFGNYAKMDEGEDSGSSSSRRGGNDGRSAPTLPPDLVVPEVPALTRSTRVVPTHAYTTRGHTTQSRAPEHTESNEPPTTQSQAGQTTQRPEDLPPTLCCNVSPTSTNVVGSLSTQVDEGEATQVDEGEATQVDKGEATQVDKGEATQVDEGEATEVDEGPPTQGPTVPSTSSTKQDFTSSTTTPQPLLCSVSETATVAALYPDDNLCDIIMYTHIRVDNYKIVAVDDAVSYETFTTVCALQYSMTSCGISFDARFVMTWQFTSAVSRQLGELRMQNVVHLGILNMYDFADRVLQYSGNVEAALEKITMFKGPASRVIYGIGFFHYNQKILWQNLEVLILASNAKDIMVIITCVLSVPSASSCIAVPPTALRSVSNYPPTFDEAVRMATEGFYTPSQVVAFSFQMGTLIYNMTDEHRLPTDALYRSCNGFIIGDSSMTCESDEMLLTAEHAVGGIATVQRRSLFYAYDTVQTMKEKAEFVMTTKQRRANFTWFLFNVHLTDISKKCHPNGPFERLREFRKFYHYMSQRRQRG